jgi:hypothetical protein
MPGPGLAVGAPSGSGVAEEAGAFGELMSLRLRSSAGDGSGVAQDLLLPWGSTCRASDRLSEVSSVGSRYFRGAGETGP